MNRHPLSRIDFRPYAGQQVIIGHTLGESTPRYEDTRFYVLGQLGQGDLPPHIKAIIQDDAIEASEALFVADITTDGAVQQYVPLVVFDDQERLRYGLEALEAVVQTGKSCPMVIIHGVHFEEEHA